MDEHGDNGEGDICLSGDVCSRVQLFCSVGKCFSGAVFAVRAGISVCGFQLEEKGFAAQGHFGGDSPFVGYSDCFSAFFFVVDGISWIFYNYNIHI